ncbi:MAG: phage portal protein [Lachnospiraceae bacterium]|nr:phage portal protein [Lachnospiraceae bacterium]
MSWLDSFINFLSPEWGAKRAAWRNAYQDMRNYDAGDGSRLNAGWRTANFSAEVTDRTSRDRIRARARDLERNSDIMNSVLGAYKRNVIGTGFALQAKTQRAKLNKDIEDLWKRWCKARNCDVTGQQSLNEILRMAVVRKKVDGGILFVKRYTKDGMIPFSLQMIEVDELDTMYSAPTAKGRRVVGGIEYNEYNRPVGYWIRQYQIDGYTIAEPQYIKADDVIFYYTKKRPSQIREISDMSPTVTRIRDVNEFITAVSVKQRIQACLSVFIKKELPVSGLGRNTSVQTDRVSYDGKTLTPGMIKELNAGDDVEVVNPTGQSADATNFTKLQQRLIGAGQGISYEATSRDMSETNYSSARQGAIEDELTYAEEQEQIFSILDEIYETFVISCVLCGRLEIPDFWDKKDKYLQHEWIQQPKKWIDPQKESSATKTALNTGQKTFKQIAAENGRDWRSQIDDMVEVLDYAKKKGIDLGGVFFDGKLATEEEKKEEPPAPDDGGDQGGNDPDAGDGAAEDGSSEDGDDGDGKKEE